MLHLGNQKRNAIGQARKAKLNHMPLALAAALAVAGLGTPSGSLRADATATFITTGQGTLWSDSTNWSGGVVPNNGTPSAGIVYDVTDNVSGASGNHPLDISSISPTIGQFTLGSTAIMYNSSGTVETVTIDPSTMSSPAGSSISGEIYGGVLSYEGGTGGGITLDIGAGNTSTAATTISGLLTQDVQLIINQPTGIVTLSNTSNNYTGGTVLDAGTLAITGNSLGTGNVALTGGNLQTTSASAVGNNIVLNAAGTIDLDGQTDSLTGVISGLGALTVESSSGSGTLTLSGANTYAGGTTVNAGTLRLGNAAALGTGAVDLYGGTLDQGANPGTISNALVVESGATTTLQATGAGSGGITFAGNITGTGTVQIAGGGSTQVGWSGANSGFTGTASVLNGSGLLLRNTNSGSASAVFTFGSLTLATYIEGDAGAGVYNLGSLSSSSSSAILDATGPGGAVTFDIGALNSSTIFAGIIRNGDGAISIDKVGTGTLTLTNANIYSGPTTISSGTLEFTGSTSGLSGPMTDNAALVFNQIANSSVSGVISGTGSVTQQGAAVLTLSGANTYSGNTTVNSGGTLDVTGSLYQGTGHGNVLANGGLDISNGFTVGSLTGTGVLDLTNTAAPLIVTLTSIFGGTVTGNGLLEASGTGTFLALNGSLTGFTGNLLAANGGNIVLGTGTGQLNSSVALDITNNLSTSLSYGTLNGNTVNFSGGTGGTLYLTGSNGTGTLGAISMANTGSATTNTLDAGGASNTLTLAGAISGSGSAVNTLVLQDGNFILTGTNTGFASGGLQVGSGSGTSVAQLISSSNLPASGVGVTLDQGQLNYTGTGNVTVTNSINTSGVGTTNILDGGSVANVITVNGSLTNFDSTNTLILQDGVFQLGGNNSGFTAGTLKIATTAQFTSTSGGLGSGASIELAGGTIQDAAGAAMIFANGVVVDSNGGTVDTNGQSVSISGAISGSGSLTVESSVGGGSLLLFGDTSGLTGNVVDNSALTFKQASNSSLSGIISGIGTVTEAGSSGTVLTLSNANTYSGPTAIVSGTLELTGDTSGLTGNVVDNSALTFSQASNSSLSGIISGIGTVTQQGTAMLMLSGANTYSGPTAIVSGTLEFTGDTSGLGGGIIDNAALVFSQAANSSLGQAVSGSGSLTQAGTATLTLSGTNTYSGNTTVNSGGTLNVTGSLYQGSGHGNVLVNGSMNVANGFTVGSLTGGGTLDLTNTAAPLIVTLTSIFGGTVNGNGLLEASGTGTSLTLNGSLAGFTGNLLAANGGNIVLGTGAGQLNSSVALDITNNLSTSLSYGTLNGNAANFSGGTGGTLYLAGSNGTGTLGAISMANTGTATTNTIDAGGASNTLTLSGAISGTGTASNTLALQDGTFVLSASNTGFTTGGIQIGDGTGTSITQFSSASNLPGSGAGVTLDQGQLNYTGTSAVTIANAISTSGSGTTSVLTNSGTGTETLTGSISNSTAGNILAFSGGTFNLNEAGSGSGTFEIGDAPSTVIVSNANAFGSGAIIVNSGSTLETNDAVAGSGSVLAITGSTYTQNANTTLKLLATGNGVNDSIQLGSGTASLNGELNLIFSGFTPAAGQHYTVIGTTGTVTGTFSSLVLTGAPSLLQGTANYISGTGEVIDLSNLAYFANLASFNPNQASVANYLNTNAVSSSTPTAIQNAMIALSSLSPSQQANYLNELTPQAYYDLPQQSIQNNTFMAQQVFNQVQNSFDGGGFNTSGLTMLKTNDQDPFAVSMDAAMQSAQQQAKNATTYMDNSSPLVGMPGVGPVVPNQESPLSNLSGFVLGTITVDQLQQNNTPTEHFTTGSVMAGLDYRLNRNLVVGALFNWGYTGGTMDNVGSRQRSSSYTPGVFVGYKQGGFYADGLMSYTYNSYQINRSVNMPGSSSIATGEPYSNEYDANALVGYYLPIARGFQAGPAAGAGFTQVNIGGFHETGSPFDLTVAKQHADSLRSLLGMQALYSFAPENNPLPISINFNAFWQHEFLDSSRDINASFTQLGGGNFIYNTAGPSRDSALLGLGASGYINKQISLFVNYETQVGDHRQFAQTVMAGVAVSF